MRISHVNYNVKLVDDRGLEDDVKKLNTMPIQLGSFVMSNSKRKMNNLIPDFNGFYTNDDYYEDNDSLCLRGNIGINWIHLNWLIKHYYKEKVS